MTSPAIMGEDERTPFGQGMPEANEYARSMRRKVQRAVARGTGTTLTANEVWALDFMEGGGNWWEAARALAKEQDHG